MRLRRARSILIVFNESRLCVYNFLTNDSFACNSLALEVLSLASNWQAAGTFFSTLSSFTSESVVRQLTQLVAFNALMVEGSTQANQDEEYEREWEWGAVAGLYHFGIKNAKFVSQEEVVTWLKEREKERPSPPLFTTNECFDKVVQLPDPTVNDPLFSVMFRRRSTRVFARTPISKQQLSDCLFAGLGIIGFVEESPFGRLPFKMTPSGGARNPYEAYVYVRNVIDLQFGMYHYSSLERSLALIRSSALPEPQVMLGGQTWPDNAAAIVFLVAQFDRTIWKYPHPNAYRIVLIEAGHIVQNIMLAATGHALGSAPTGAICDAVMEQALELTSLSQSVVYAVAIGVPEAGIPPS